VTKGNKEAIDVGKNKKRITKKKHTRSGTEERRESRKGGR